MDSNVQSQGDSIVDLRSIWKIQHWASLMIPIRPNKTTNDMKSLLERICLGFDPKLDHQIFPTNILINQQRLRDKGVVMICNDRYHCMAHIQYFYDMILRLQATIYNFISLLIKKMCLTCYMGLSESIIPHSIHCWLIILILQFQGITPFSDRTVSTYDFFLHGPLIISHDLP